VIGDDRQRLDAGAAELAILLAVAAKEMGEIGGGLEVPALAAADDLDAAPGIERLQRRERGADIQLGADMGADLVEAERRLGGEQHRLDRARGIVLGRHAGALR
jgi:hypothetical protein